MTNIEQLRQEAERILDKNHEAHTATIQSISTPHFPVAYKQSAIDAMIEFLESQSKIPDEKIESMALQVANAYFPFFKQDAHTRELVGNLQKSIVEVVKFQKTY